eukprot:CAMPEP_0195519256 /NCGR_PEP_ID=MMETSP0794_2-20130614/14541_1 /TAXON_ID=515487 /ORGANISM="Stephanopyxis turris, Strain CCMP 815" /LENGTH=407 /DNA_ID=CAMNT_0040648379 /DNA_START=71 /DNA_END=1294 /DNA_ORIENTATION=+
MATLFRLLLALSLWTAVIANDAVDSADHGDELEQLRQLERQHRKQFDALLSVVEKQQEQIETLNSRLSKLDPDVDDMHARHLSTVDNLTAYSGLQVKKEKSMVALGPEADIKMLRTDFGTLEILAETVLVHGVLEVKDLVVNGTSITDLITPPPPVYNMTVNVLTASVTSSESTSTFLVEFFVGGTGWTDPVEFFSGTSKDEIHVKSFAVSGKPSKIRFSIDGNDAWGIAQAAVAFNDDPEMVVLCSTVLGATPALGNNGHWVDGDSTAPVSVVYDLVPACASFVSITAETGHLTNSGSDGTIYLSFYVNGSWTSPEIFFSASSIGDVETQNYGLTDIPTQLAFTISNNDAWGFDFLQVDVDDDTYILSCDSDQTGMSSTSEHWVDGDGSGGVVDELVLDIEHTDCS